jgi:alpha-2-macroglobulin
MVQKFLAAAVTAAALFVAACSGSQSVDKESRAAPPDPSWVTSISQHSSGAISRHSPVRVYFTTDVVPEALVGKDAAANIAISPAVKTKATFASRREIVLRPETEFAPSTSYKVSVAAKGLTGVPADTKPFEFVITTLGVNFDVRMHGLDVEHDRNELMTLRGAVQTADRENRELVEKIVTATLGGEPVKLVWEPSGDNYYSFTVREILRKKEEQELVVSWNGAPLKLDQQGSQSWRVPALDEFAVTQAHAVEVDDQRQIQIRFSDALDARQDLKGQVRLSRGEFTTSIQQNLLTLYVNQDLTGEVTLNLEEAVRSRSGQPLIGEREFKLEFQNTKPQVRFVGNGVILPDAEKLTVPFEAVSARSVRVTALQVFEANIPQFLQVNNLSGGNELGRVGRVLWHKTITLASPVPGRWTRYDLDVTELMKKHPGGLFQLTLSLSPKDSTFDCGQEQSELAKVEDADVASQDDESGGYNHSSYYYEEEYDEYGEVVWSERTNPCKPAYFRYGQNIRASRNLLASNIGLIAKRGAKGKFLAIATALDSAKPLAGVKINAVNFQNQVIVSGATGSDGSLELDPKSQPFALIAEQDGRKGYLRVAPNMALPTSHFDVGGETVVNGIKGHLYGDRGVWRPGDSIYLTLAIEDETRQLPSNHPVTLELRNPRGQLTQTLTSTTPVGQFYAFELKTTSDAPTGTWNAQAMVGGATFTKALKVETVMPNRLKIELDLGDKAVVESSPLKGTVSSQWLSGATASGLRANVEVRLSPAPTYFPNFKDHVFDDPARSYTSEPVTVFDEALDENGVGRISHTLEVPRDAPGMLNANFVTRVFERGGAFSINMEKKTIAAFDKYVGIKLPKGDPARDALLTDTEHTLDIASVNLDGAPVAMPRVQVSLYKIEWRWWWDRGGESLARYAQGESSSLLKKEIVSTKNGRGTWKFGINYPEWGRYLVRVCDLDGGHCAGSVFYVDWPAWQGAQREQSGPAATVLTLTADKPEYKVGDTAIVQMPEASQGRALLTLENGSTYLEHRWIEAKPGANRVQIPITAGMAPVVYVAVTMVQPHAGKTNDRPIRLYGVIPLKVTDPKTHIAPVVATPAEWAPQSKATVTVSESAGRAMDYTLAVVDEGLLGLTNFKTPNLHAEFYKREALGVYTWDLFDEVAGAYGGQLDRLLALGGSDGAGGNNPDEGKSRFPPVVKFLGPFQLKAGEKRAHTIELPQYVGAVRVMVVAGDGSAYGSAEKSVFVRQPLMILPTLPRVLGPAENFTLPVSVFTSDASIRNVKLEVQTDARFAPVGEASAELTFTKPEEKLGFLALKSGTSLGVGKIKVIATSGKHRAESEVYLEVRSPNTPSSRFTRATIAPGESFTGSLAAFGLPGTQSATLEVSALPPINLDSRLDYLVQYPHGCLEQTTSGAFPQLYLPSLIKMDQNKRLRVEDNIRKGLARLRSLQHPSGGFSYWPGVWNTNAERDWRTDWGTTYAGHFFLEAEKAGYTLPGDMKTSWIKFQKNAAQQWNPGTVLVDYKEFRRQYEEASRYAQAYRLYTLALAGQPEIGAMNRLRETRTISLAEQWLLAAAYKLAGKPEVAREIVSRQVIQAFVFADANPYTFGSLLRDRAVVLMGMTLLGRDAETGALLEDISAQLSSGEWYSTQSVAFALVAVAQNTGAKPFKGFSFDYSAGKARTQTFKGESSVVTLPLAPPPAAGLPLALTNTSDRKLYMTAAVRATPASGEENSSENGLDINIVYTDADGTPIDPRRIRQGSDLIAQVSVKNVSKLPIDNLALTQLVPGGWEIRNDRLEEVSTEGERSQDDPNYRGRFWWVPQAWRNSGMRNAEYTDIRDDRLLRYFSLNAGESIFFETRLNAAYLGRFYLPGTGIEAMYDAKQHAREKGTWVEVVAP